MTPPRSPERSPAGSRPSSPEPCLSPSGARSPTPVVVSETELGSGQFATVFVGEHGGAEVAVKLLTSRAHAKLADAFAEANAALSVLPHPAVQELFGVSDSPGPAIISEVVPGVPMSVELYPHGGRASAGPLEAGAKLVAHLAGGVQHLHEYTLVHRDLKPENVMVWKESRGWGAKIIDFGMSVQLKHAKSLKRTGLDGSPLYASPEVFALADISTADDVWALGCIGAEVFGSGRPFSFAKSLADLAEFARKRRPPFASLPKGIAAPLAESLRHCFRPANSRTPAGAVAAAAS